jgi:nucleoside-diphosphate-sugar epimerase
MKKILITGASGFIGSFIVEEALARGMEVWAGVRKSSSRRYLQDERIHFIDLNLDSKEQLKQQLSSHTFDYIVHAAGVTKCINKADFFRVNTEGTRHLVDALIELQMPLEHFVFISSLSVFGAIREKQPYEPIRDTDTPQPNTAYGQSKLEAEKVIKERSTPFPYTILRPTGVYGPRERDYFLMAKSIKGHSDFSVGYQQQDITFVYVKDVVQAVFLALHTPHSTLHTPRCYFLSDGEVYQSSTFSDLIIKEMGNPWCLRIKAPIWVLRVVTACGEWLSHFTGKISALNNDKYHILKQRNWQCDIQPAIDELGYKPQYNLERGVKETIAWYKKEGWL